jgi:hypothetical protein
MVSRAQIGSLVARHRGLVIALLFGGAALAVFVFLYFEPQKLFLDQEVNEAAPEAASRQSVSVESPPAVGEVVPEAAAPATAPPQPRQLASGAFRSLEHSTVGTATVVELPDGGRVLRLEGFETSNGPDLRVYLSAGSNDAFFGREYGRDFVELGELKGNIGSQNYPIPSSVDLAKYRNAVIWCKRFSVGFGVATLQ